MRYAMVLVGVLGAWMSGCTESSGPQPSGNTEVKKSNGAAESEKTQGALKGYDEERRALYEELAKRTDGWSKLFKEESEKSKVLQSVNEKIIKQLEDLQAANKSMQERITSLTNAEEREWRNALAATNRVKVQIPQSPPAQDKQRRIEQLTRQKADLQRQITDIQTALAIGRIRMETLSRATAGKWIIYQKAQRTTTVPGTTYSYSYTEIVPSGEIQGDFRTEHEKTKAVDAVRIALVPLYVQLRENQEQLTGVQKELVELQKP